MEESRFNGITLRSVSKQLNTEISTLNQDIIYAMSQINAIGLFSTIETIFDDIIDMKPLKEASNNNTGNARINLCHLFGLMFTFKCTINLTHISNINNNNNDDTKSNIEYDIDLNIIQLFEQQNKNNKYKLCCKLLDHIEICKQQNPPILLYHDDNIYGTVNNKQCKMDANSSKFNLNSIFINIAMRNDKIWKQCKVGIKTKCSTNNKVSIISSSSSTEISSNRSSSKPSSKKYERHHQKNAILCMKIPKKDLGPYHDKNYHLFGRQYNLPSISMEEVIKHNTKESCWIIIHGLVLDVTSFLSHHPASAQCILRNGGKNCDRHFKFHSKIAHKLFWKFVIGKVQKQNDCIIQ